MRSLRRFRYRFRFAGSVSSSFRYRKRASKTPFFGRTTTTFRSSNLRYGAGGGGVSTKYERAAAVNGAQVAVNRQARNASKEQRSQWRQRHLFN